MIKTMRYIVNFKDVEMRQFYKYEGKLATHPIIEFIDKHSITCHGKLVDIGCGSKPYMKYFSNIDEYIGVDLSNGADIVANAKSLPIASNSVDAVLCNQVIEHDAEPNKILKEISRILKRDGILILSAPQMGRLHGEPNDYLIFRFLNSLITWEKDTLGYNIIANKKGGH